MRGRPCPRKSFDFLGTPALALKTLKLQGLTGNRGVGKPIALDFKPEGTRTDHFVDGVVDVEPMLLGIVPPAGGPKARLVALSVFQRYELAGKLGCGITNELVVVKRSRSWR